MARSILVLACIVLTAGCATGRGAIEKKWNATRDALLSQLVYPECKGANPRAKCGLVSDLPSMQLITYKKAMCDKMSDHDCMASFSRVFSHMLRERYPLASPEEAVKMCDASAGLCEEHWGYEVVMLRMHDNAVLRQLEQQQNEFHAEINKSEKMRELWIGIFSSLGSLRDAQRSPTTTDTLLNSGVTYNQIGDTIYGSDGSTATRIGNTINFSNGKTCNRIGSMVHCN